MLLSSAWICIGVGILINANEDPNQHITLIQKAPDSFRAALWIVPAVVTFVLAVDRKPQGDRWGYTLLVFAPAVRAFSYTLAAVLGIVTDIMIWAGIGSGVRLGNTNSWLSAVFWVAVTLFIMRQARRPDPVGTPAGEPSL